MNKPKKWYDVYPYGTKAGDEEAKIFRFLSRNPKYKWRSLSAMQKETGLSMERIEEIIDKYVNNYNPPLIYANPANEDSWGYWERVADDVLDDDTSNLSSKDKDNRIDKHLKTSPDIVFLNPATSPAPVI